MELVERAEQEKELGRIIEECGSGKGAVVLIEGPGGSGRTELLHRAAQAAGQHGGLVLQASCSRSESALPFGVLGQLLYTVPGAEGPVGRLQALYRRAGALASSAADRAASAGPGADAPGARPGARPDSPAVGTAPPAPAALAPERAALLDEAAQAVLELAETSLVFIGVDDIRHADAHSLDCLLYLVRRTGSARVVTVLTDGAPDTSPHTLGTRSHFRTELLDQPHTHRIPLEPLTESQVAAVLMAELGTDGARLAAEFHAVSGGSLLLLTALLDDHRASGGVRREGYGRAVLRQLGRLDEPVAAVARALAVLGSADPSDRLARLAGAEPSAAQAALATLGAVGLADGPVLRHELTRQVILDELPAAERTALRSAAARLLYEEGLPAQEIAPLLTEAERPSGEWSVGILLEAAEQELLAGRPHRSAATLEAALRAHPEADRERAAIEARLVQVRRLSDPAIAEHHLTALTKAALDGDVSPANTVDLVRQLLWQGRSKDAGELLERLRSRRLEPHSEVAALLEDTERWIAWTHPTLARRTQPHRGPKGAAAPGPHDRHTAHPAGGARALHAAPDRHTSPTAPGTRAAPAAPTAYDRHTAHGTHGGHPPADPRRAGGRRPQSAAALSRPTALLADALVTGRAHQVVDQAHRVLRGRGPGYDVAWPEEPALLALTVLMCTDAPDTAAWCDRLLREGHTPYSPTWMGLLSATRAEAALRLGDLTGAVDHAQQALNHISPNAWGVAVGRPLGSLVLATTRMGHYDEAGSYLTRAVPKAMSDTRFGLHYLHARGQYHLATGHHHAALADFLTCGERMRNWGIDVPGVVPWRTSAAEAWLALGNREQAGRLAYDQLGRSGVHGARARAGALRALAVGGPAARRPQMLSEALELYERCGDRYEQIRVLSDLGQTCHELGDNRRARTHVRRARHLVALCGAAPLRDGLLSFPDDPGQQQAPAASGAPEDGRTPLTGSERRVAALAVGGYTNREIAAKLFITPSTVEQHLTRVYRKLGVRCRKDLPVELSTSGSDDVRAAVGQDS